MSQHAKNRAQNPEIQRQRGANNLKTMELRDSHREGNMSHLEFVGMGLELSGNCFLPLG